MANLAPATPFQRERCRLYSGVCVVCLEDFVVGSAVYLTPCHHVFHRQCMHEIPPNIWSCPVCRGGLQNLDPPFQYPHIDEPDPAPAIPAPADPAPALPAPPWVQLPPWGAVQQFLNQLLIDDDEIEDAEFGLLGGEEVMEEVMEWVMGDDYRYLMQGIEVPPVEQQAVIVAPEGQLLAGAEEQGPIAIPAGSLCRACQLGLQNEPERVSMCDICEQFRHLQCVQGRRCPCWDAEVFVGLDDVGELYWGEGQHDDGGQGGQGGGQAGAEIFIGLDDAGELYWGEGQHDEDGQGGQGGGQGGQGHEHEIFVVYAPAP